MRNYTEQYVYCDKKNNMFYTISKYNDTIEAYIQNNLGECKSAEVFNFNEKESKYIEKKLDISQPSKYGITSWWLGTNDDEYDDFADNIKFLKRTDNIFDLVYRYSYEWAYDGILYIMPNCICFFAFKLYTDYYDKHYSHKSNILEAIINMQKF